jgi:hypothetical protein
MTGTAIRDVTSLLLRESAERVTVLVCHDEHIKFFHAVLRVLEHPFCFATPQAHPPADLVSLPSSPSINGESNVKSGSRLPVSDC